MKVFGVGIADNALNKKAKTVDSQLDAAAAALEKPSYNYKAVMSTRKKLAGVLGKVSVPLVGDVFVSLVGQVKMALPVVVTLETVTSCLSAYMGKSLSAVDRRIIAKRLAGNLPQLVLQQSVLSWCYVTKPEWVLATIAEVTVVRRKSQLVNRLVFDAITGSCAGYDLMAFWSFKKFNFLATLLDKDGHGFGLTRPRLNKLGDDRSNYTYSSYIQLSGMHCFLLLDPRRSHLYPEFYTIGHGSGTMRYNRQLLAARVRNRSPCVLNSKISYDCYSCSMGRDRCDFAIREKTCIKSVCQRCKADSLLDPSDPDYSHLCLSCARKAKV